MSAESEKNPLEDLPFSFHRYKNGGVSVFYKNKEVTILKGAAAEKFVSRVKGASEMDAQLAMAKITGHFKHGNERMGREKRR